MIKIAFVLIAFIYSIITIILVQRLPIKEKSLEWNLDARLNLYIARDIINIVLTVIFLHTLPKDPEGYTELKDPSNMEMVAVIVVTIISFAVNVISDTYAIKKRLKPYVKTKPDEYNEYLESETRFGPWNTVTYATFSAMIIIVFLMAIIGG